MEASDDASIDLTRAGNQPLVAVERALTWLLTHVSLVVVFVHNICRVNNESTRPASISRGNRAAEGRPVADRM
jgi:hypothetical protein